MTTLRRLTTSIKANFDWMISQVENHEALVDSAIQEIVRSRSKAAVQLTKVKNDGSNLKARIKELELEEQRWKERALKIKESDEKRAMECLKRRKNVVRDHEYCKSQYEVQIQLETQLVKDLALIDERLDALKRKRNALRTRQSRAEALRSTQVDDTGIIHELDSILERWEVKVSEYEHEGQCTMTPADGLEDQFIKEEEEAELRVELENLN